MCIAEGYATGASIHEATGAAVAVAFHAGNLVPVARALRTKFPDLRLIVCADDDVNTPGNPGLAKANEAAQAVGALLAIPDFGGHRPDGATDFNDLHRQTGREAVRAAIARAMPVESVVDETHNAWPEPKPIIGELKPVPAFDADTLLPKALRAWIMDEAERMPCPPDFIAAAALVALGSIIGARCAIKPKARDSWLIVPNLWGGIVGDPSAKKSPAWGAALKPLDRLIAKALEAHTAALADYETDESRLRCAEGRHRRTHQGGGEEAEQRRSGEHREGTAHPRRASPGSARRCGATRPTTARWKSWASCCAKTPPACWCFGMNWSD